MHYSIAKKRYNIDRAIGETMKIYIEKNTVFKLRMLDSRLLPDSEKVSVYAGKVFKLHSYKVERDHVKVALLDDTLKGFNTWYAYLGHVRIESQGRSTTLVVPDTKDLPVPFLSQLNNRYDPGKTCNITSLCMCINYYHANKVTYGISELKPDDLYQYAQKNNFNIYDPLDLVKIGRHYGVESAFTFDGKFDRIKAAINSGKPCIVHGYFTGDSGHIVVIKGYNEKGFIVNDPWGRYYHTGYDNNASGHGLVYSYQLIREVCMPDDSLWLHVVHNKG